MAREENQIENQRTKGIKKGSSQLVAQPSFELTSINRVSGLYMHSKKGQNREDKSKSNRAGKNLSFNPKLISLKSRLPITTSN